MINRASIRNCLNAAFCLLLLTIIFGSCEKQSDPVHHILMIHSFDKNNPIYPPLTRAIIREFKENGVRVKIHTLYLNSEIYWPHEKNAIIRNFLNKNAAWKPELLLVNDDQALFSIVNSNNKRSHKIPIIFAGVNYLPTMSMAKFKYDNIAGFYDEPDIKENIAFIETLMGKMIINVNYDQTHANDYPDLVCGNLYQQLEKSPYRMDFSVLYKNGLVKTKEDSLRMPVDSLFLKRQLELRTERPDSSYVRFVNFRHGMSGEALWNFSNMRPYVTFLNTSYTFASNKICQLFDRPVFTAVHEGFDCGSGILGGYFTTAEQQAKEQVGAAIRFFNGTTIKELGIHKSKKEYVLDWKTMFRWNWKPVNVIPPYVKIVNEPFYIRYEKELIWGGTSLSVFILIIFVALSYFSLRERRKKELAEQNLRLERMYLSLALRNGNIFVWRIEDAPYLIFGQDFFDAMGIPYDHQLLSQGYSIDELCEKVHPDDRQKFVSDTKFVLARENRGRTTRCRIDFNGKGYQWWEFRSGEVFLNNLKKSYMIVGLCLNIQEYKDNEQILINAREKAEEADRMKSAFVANMSHDIRTPLNAIVGFSNLLIEDGSIDPEEKAMCIDTINMNTKHLLKLINDILDLSRIEAGSMKYTLKECNMHELLREVYNTHLLLMPKNVKFEMSLPEKEMVVITDYHRIVEVLTNLLSNSIKFTEKGYISMGYTQDSDGQGIIIYVKDTGKGIPLDKQKSVFERFTKVDEYAKGSGLGLVICKHIVERLGGTIQLASDGEGKGSCFTIYLPMKVDKV